jgi:hypothetical protein
MAECTYFVRECPTCGRNLHIRVEFLGKSVVCQHCRRRFLANDASALRPDVPEPSPSLLARADELIDLVDQRRNLPR